jgi:DGQHR domain-containing protein
VAKASSDSENRPTIPALRVQQWLKAWDQVDFSPEEHRRKPETSFLLFSLPAHDLRRLCGIRRRDTATGARASDLGIQRRHDSGRSEEIADFVRHGFPWSDLNRSQRKSGRFDDLKKPGWLPTAVVVNILTAGEERSGTRVSEGDLIRVHDSDGRVELELPASFSRTWEPSGCEPIEVIDGQHRLWAFENQLDDDRFQLPVVAFVGLDISWQAYLFWTINIKPKRINASLAFDLYPLLRTEDWLERFQGVSVYRETRAQELTEALWSYPASPWRGRINMLGEPGVGGVSQAAWIRSLVATYVRASEGRGVKLGGLFGAPVGEDELTLPWTRAQQAAFLVRIWSDLRDAVAGSDAPWAQSLRATEGVAAKDRADSGDKPAASRDAKQNDDPAFEGRFSLLNGDQGVRAFLHVTNDLCVLASDQLRLQHWLDEDVEGTISEGAISAALKSLNDQPLSAFVRALSAQLAQFDWRTSSTPGLPDAEREVRAGFRGTGGYKELRRHLLRHLATGPEPYRSGAAEAVEILGLAS